MINQSTAISYLQNQQLNHGGFTSYSSTTLVPFSTQAHHHTIFMSALILSALQNISEKNSLITGLKNHLTQFLLAQKSKHWTWNYWIKYSSEAKLFPLPDDLDDSSCAWIALYQQQPQLFTGKVMAQITHTLVKLETKPSGPYHTWVIANTKHRSWSGVDLIVNSNIAYFLKLLQIELPPLTAFFDQHILNHNYTSQYYPTPYPGLYFLARSYTGQLKNKIIDYLLSLQQPDLTWGNPLNTTLASTALLRLGYSRPQLIATINHYLTTTQLDDGSWPAASFCYDPSINHQPHYAGAASLTTALVLEYLNLAHSLQLKPTPTKITSLEPTNNWPKELHTTLIKLPPSMQPLIKTTVAKLQRADRQHHIANWATQFAHSLTKTKPTKIRYLSQLNQANLWGWLAYIIYDDVLDQDAPVEATSLANIAQRQLMNCYQSTIKQFPQFLSVFTQIMDGVDLANWHELNSRAQIKNNTLYLPTTLPNYSPLTLIARKSLGHALGPIAILYQLGYSLNDKPIRDWLQFMHHYLTARQLHDDAHDWQEDCQRGHLSPVVVQLLKVYLATTPAPTTIKLDTHHLVQLQQLFWTQILPQVIGDIQHQLQLAQAAITNSSLIVQPQFFLNLLQKLAATATHSLNQQQQAVEFITAY